MSILLVCCNFPDKISADSAAQAVIGQGLAACCQVGAPVASVYRWQGRVEQAEEFPLTCKTTPEAWADLEAFLKLRHPYDVPEIIGLPVTHGLPAYLEWVRANVPNR